MLDLTALLALDPQTAPDEAFEGWTSGNFPDRVPALIQPIKGQVSATWQKLYDLGGPARTMANEAKNELLRRLAHAAPAIQAPGVDPIFEQPRGERDQIRVWIQFFHYFEAILAAEVANRSVSPDFARWPSLPHEFPPRPRPMFKPDTSLLFKIDSWIEAHAEQLLDGSRVRVKEGRELRVRGFTAEDTAVMREHERAIATWIEGQFARVSPQFYSMG